MGGDKGWVMMPFGHLVDNFDSIRVPVKEADRKPGQYPYYGASGVVDHVDRYIFDGDYLLVAEDGENLKTRQTPIAFLATGRFWVNNHAHIVRANPNNDTRFLMYAMHVADVGSYLTGSTMPKLTQANLNRVPVVAPPLPTQRAIAHILGTLDDKIELNRQMNETLEAMARALFKSWFVDFDPVRAKAAGRQPAGMDAATAKLFPDAFEMSELGEIPRGWAWSTLGAVSHLNPESWTANNRPSEIRYVDLSNTKWGRIESTSRYVWSEAPSRAQRILRGGDTIFGVVRPGNGSFALVRQSGLTGSTGFAVLRSKSALHAPFVYLAATAKENVDRLSHLADGAAYPAIRPELLLETPIMQTHANVLDAFGSEAELYLAKMAANDMQSESLNALRDTLLPPLLSGELSIPDAERFVGRAV